MNSQTSLVAEQTRLAQWASDIKDCQNRPNGMKIDDWCAQHGITKANYYYRLRRVRGACLASVKPANPTPTAFAELPVPAGALNQSAAQEVMQAFLKLNRAGRDGRTEISPPPIRSLMNVFAFFPINTVSFFLCIAACFFDC